MNKMSLLLIGNGINISLNKEFSLNKFIDILKNYYSIKQLYQQLYFFGNDQYTEEEIDIFFKAIERSEKLLNEVLTNSEEKGVEDAIIKYTKQVNKWLILSEDKIRDKFIEFFKSLFVGYIYNLESTSQFIFNPYFLFDKYKEKIKKYDKIFTLNYDSILEEQMQINQSLIIHLHGRMIYDRTNQKLDFSNCLLSTYNFPKYKSNIPQLLLIKERNNYIGEYDLDIFGLNPINDYDIFALFIISKVLNNINFYYHTSNDLENFINMLHKISYWKLIDLKTGYNLQKEPKDKGKLIESIENSTFYINKKLSDEL
ncbi:hypothetical protein [Spiroplasma eriocheiris]|uniref:Uncharacterized protein n=1 Tax=Spiroplasma eriocheiris TaxID=315358 RepID=A0A0H3XN01_9MOLU|nr:hypothetical protein [Spiroplasma eriocheiris]AHF58046.1 hypothtetical protein [Spiroplasma eriocheiris CCTCC M 207170]AKM54487.1 hypothetical protein SERIO_v1c09270 [Spiroplasma eriocheiris]